MQNRFKETISERGDASLLDITLTPNLVKSNIYRSDAEFGVGIDFARQYFISTEKLQHRLWNSASLLLRPDAIAGRQSSSIVPELRAHGFVPIVVQPVQLTAAQAMKLWRYQINVATSARRAIIEMIMTAGPSLYIILHDRSRRSSAPATVHLTYIKGTAIIARRNRWHLRTIAGPGIANTLSYVHVSDDPADLLREMAVLLPQQSYASIFSAIDRQQDLTEELLKSIKTLERALPEGLLRSSIVPPEPTFKSECANTIETRRHWQKILYLARKCVSFTTGETYNGKDAIVPDDKWLSLPLDGHLIFPELGRRW